MRIDKVYISHFKNLSEFNIDLDEDHLYTVLLGRNASGKSNFMEALIIIFRDLIADNLPQFEYKIDYECSGHIIQVTSLPSKKSKKSKNKKTLTYQFIVDNENTTKVSFRENRNLYLPRNVFAYYSGVNNRFEGLFHESRKKFLSQLLNEEINIEDDLRPMFLATTEYGFLVLLSFLLVDSEEGSKFLKDYLGIEELYSILFKLKKPDWATQKRPGGDKRFWYAKGVVANLLSSMYELALAPIKDTELLSHDYKTSSKTELLYLFFPTLDKLRELASIYGKPIDFFKILESLKVSDLVEDIRADIKKRGVNTKITFKDLSEGEQQLLTVFGLLKFTMEEESLILLDEPDTHLNPYWKWQYIKLIEDVVKKPDKSHLIMSTHDPLVIGGLEREQIRVFYRNPDDNKIATFPPDFSPKGMSVDGILTNDFFGLPTTLDKGTQIDLDRKRELQAKGKNKKLTKKEKKELEGLIQDLQELGFSRTTRDPLYSKFLERIAQIEVFKDSTKSLSKEEIDDQEKLIDDILNEIIKEEKG